jgi:hypothetical protein
MKLVISRSQRTAGMLTSKVMFALTARLDLTEEESHLLKKYKLHNTTIYNSDTAQKHLDHADADRSTGSVLGAAKSVIRIGLAALSLRCTYESLTKGQTIECKEMGDLLAAEAAIVEACQTAKAFLEISKTFDGKEQVIEI